MHLRTERTDHSGICRGFRPQKYLRQSRSWITIGSFSPCSEMAITCQTVSIWALFPERLPSVLLCSLGLASHCLDSRTGGRVRSLRKRASRGQAFARICKGLAFKSVSIFFGARLRRFQLVPDEGSPNGGFNWYKRVSGLQRRPRDEKARLGEQRSKGGSQRKA